MIIYTRTADIAPGHTAEAWALAKEIVALHAAKTGNTMRLMSPIGGNPGQIVWQATMESLAVLEDHLGFVTTDPEYIGLVAGAGDYFIPGSVRDTIHRVIA